MTECPKCGSKWITKIKFNKVKKVKNVCLHCNNIVYEVRVSELDKKQFIKEK